MFQEKKRWSGFANIDNIDKYTDSSIQWLKDHFKKSKKKKGSLKQPMWYIDLRPGQTCHSKVMHRKEVVHSDGSYEKNRVGGHGLKKLVKVKILL